MSARTPARTSRVAPVVRPDNSVAARQFVKNLERQAAREELDAVLYARWMARRPAVLAAEKRERKLIGWILAAGLVVTLTLAAAVVYLLMSAGLPLLLALLLAVLIATPTGGGGCWITVIVMHGH